MFPVLLRCIGFSDASLKLSMLHIFRQLPLVTLEEHISTLVSTYLELADASRLEKGNTMAVRCNALQALADLARRLDFMVLYPVKFLILEKLIPCLDDPKRIVRKAAVDCQTRFQLLKK